MVVRMVLHIVKFVNGFPRWGGVKHYSPGEIMMDCCLNANDLQLSFGVYCQVAENVEPRNSLAPRTRAAISLGNSGNLSGGQMFFALDTGHNITQHQWVLLPMQPAVIAGVNLFGKDEPFILTFTDRHGREIGDHPQDYEPSGNDDNSVVELISDVIPGVDPTPEDDAELPGVDTDYDAEPTGVEVDSDYVPQELTGRCDKQEAWGKRNIIVLWVFLSHLLRLLNLQINTQPTPPAEFLGNGVAQSIKAVPLDRQPAPPWWCY
jgi:hypothetical protein